MNDDRISRYLSDQAEGIPLAPADPAGVMRRGARRRTRRRTAFAGSLAVVAVLATAVALRDGSDDQQVDSNVAAPGVAASTFDWSTVSPDAGLAWSSSSVELGGTIYSLSTAPASGDRSTVTDAELRPTLYRSDDGAEWSQITGPDGVRVSSLAGAGDALYALGTAPAGGNTRDLVVATSTDGASTWSNVTLPRDVADLEARHPGEIIVGQPRLVARDASHLVASISVTANIDPAQYMPEINEGDRAYSVEWTDDGLVVRDMGPSCVVYEDGGRDAWTAEPADITCMAQSREAASKDEGEVVFQKTFDELGIDQELRGLVGGRSITYVSEDGATFERVDVPETAGEWTAGLLATADGYRMVRGSYGDDPTAAVATVLRSTDGRTWTVDAQLPGSPGNLGLLGDRVAVSIFDEVGNHVSIQQPDGQWVDLDLTRAVDVPDGHQAWVGEVAFGPLGFAAVVGTSDDQGNSGESFLVHSTDGSVLSVLSVSDVVEGGVSPVGLTVSADAIAARFSLPPDGDDETPARQIVLVGTPTG